MPYTAIQAVLDASFPYRANCWDKGVFIDCDPGDVGPVKQIIDPLTKAWTVRPDFAVKPAIFLLMMEVVGAVRRADPASTSFSVRNGRLWTTAFIGWADQRAAAKKSATTQWRRSALSTLPAMCTTAMPASDVEIRAVFPEETMKRLQALMRKYDSHGMFRAGASDCRANVCPEARRVHSGANGCGSAR